MKRAYIAILASLVLVSVFLVNFLPFGKSDPSRLSEQLAVDVPPLPMPPLSRAVTVPGEAAAVPAPPFGRNVPGGVTPVAAITPVLTQGHEPPSAPILPSPSPTVVPADFFVTARPAPAEAEAAEPVSTAVAAPVPYIYFYTGIPVRTVPATPAVYANGGMPYIPVTNMTPVVSMPIVQSYGVPVFVPQVVPSRVGSPKWVYSNGVVIKPKVYFPRQPVRNSMRGLTP